MIDEIWVSSWSELALKKSVENTSLKKPTKNWMLLVRLRLKISKFYKFDQINRLIQQKIFFDYL